MIPSSFRDPSGFLFQDNGRLYRQINQQYKVHFDRLMQSGLYDKLTQAGLLIPHHAAETDLARTDTAYQIIQPDIIPFISYPYEWSFSQLKDTALATLRIQKIALRHGMTLKDASAYNIQFYHGKPLLIDSLSFEVYRDGQAWIPYRQFCQHFLAPLALMALRDVRLNQLLRVHIDGIPLDLAAKLLPRRAYFKLSLLLHIFLHVRGQAQFTNRTTKQPRNQRQLSKQSLENLIDNLIAGIQSLNWQPAGGDFTWTDYYQGDSYTQTGFDHKKLLVQQFVEQAAPHTAWDLGANTGVFSRILSDKGIFTVSCDIDPGAVEINYRQMVKQQEQHLHPLLVDLTNPSPAIGWANQERDTFGDRGQPDLVMALALIHHLAISNNVPLGRIAQEFARLGRWLIVEFVPKQDKKVQQLLATREDIFTHYTPAGFEAAFEQYFEIVRAEAIHDSERRLYLMRVRDK